MSLCVFVSMPANSKCSQLYKLFTTYYNIRVSNAHVFTTKAVMHGETFSKDFNQFFLQRSGLQVDFSKFNCDSIGVQRKNSIKMKRLETGRKMLSWFCTDASNEPLNRYQTLARMIFLFTFGVIFVTMAVAANSSLFSNHTLMNDLNELFFEIFQFVATLYAASAVIATFVWGPNLASIFRDLENIHNACKDLISYCIYFCQNFTGSRKLPQLIRCYFKFQIRMNV